MINQETYTKNNTFAIRQKINDYFLLGKLRLSLVVVFSAGIAFLIGSEVPRDWSLFFILVLGGVLITISANSINEILERKYDALMTRTSKRPLPAGRMTIKEAIFFSIITGSSGILILYLTFDILTSILGLMSLVLYSFVYTPIKRIGSIAVIVGAIPGALPVVIGYIAAKGEFDSTCLMLFTIQFLWQLPHFWAIAWIADEDYRKAGYFLLPFGGKKNLASAIQIFLSNIILLVASLLPYYYFNQINHTAHIIILMTSILFCFPSIRLILNHNRKSALYIMFGSFIYLPIVLISFFLGKL